MAVIPSWASSGFSSLPLPLKAIALFILLMTLTFAFTHIYTHARYNLTFPSPPSDSTIEGKTTTQTPRAPPKIPYTIPFLGHGLWFLDPPAPKPGKFWKELMAMIPRWTGACTIQLGPETTHVLYDPLAIEALMKVKNANRDRFNFKVVHLCFGMPVEEAVRYYGKDGEVDNYMGKEVTVRSIQELMYHELLMKQVHANELTTEFVRFLDEALDSGFSQYALGPSKQGDEAVEIPLIRWVRDVVFRASVNSLMGSRLLEEYPELVEEYWPFDKDVLQLFFGVPKFFVSETHARMERIVSSTKVWRDKMIAETNGEIVDPRDPDVPWEPRFGSRVQRARQVYYRERGLNARSCAAADIGLVFGLESNSVPATQWMLLHIIYPTNPSADPNILPKIMAEIDASKTEDGKLDFGVLAGQPLLQSTFYEVLRLYTDVLISRDLNHDVVLPVDGGRRDLVFNKGTTVMAPSYLGHHDSAAWEDVESFRADRFLIPADPANPTGPQKFSLNGTAGKLFPWGGGKTICPGRVFAKQEVIAAVATILSRFDTEVLRFVDDNGKETGKFPGLRPAYSGTAVMYMEGDAIVRIRRKT